MLDGGSTRVAIPGHDGRSLALRLSDAQTERAQLQTALDSRVVIEQAKGVLSERLGITVDEAFTMLRDHARCTNQRLHTVAAAVVGRRLDLPTT